MYNEAIDRVHVMSLHIKSEVGITFECKYGTKIVDEPHDEPNEYIEDNDSYYYPYYDKNIQIKF